MSEASIIVFKQHDYYDTGISNCYSALWVHRPDDPRDANREAVKACKFWGYPLMYERVMDAVIEDFEEAKMVPFLLNSPKDGKRGMVVDSGGKTVKNALDRMVTRFSNPKTKEDPDMIATMPFEPVLLDLDGIDISNTTKYNVFMSMVELEYALQQIQYTNMTDDRYNASMSKVVNEIFPTRN